MTDALLFDMDGVLVDTTASYRHAILACFRHIAADLPANLLDAWATPDTLRTFKAASGFNNDWCLTEALVLLASTPEPSLADPETLPHTLARAATLAPGLEGVRRLLGQPADQPLPGTAPMSPLVAVFQSAYLGRDLLARLHPHTPYTPVAREDGLIRTETLLVSPQCLQRAVNRFRLGIATGRPRGEALFALEHHGIEHFGAVVTHDDVLEASRRDSDVAGKPHPWPLLEALRQLDVPPERCLGYLGDLPDDMRAATAAAIPGLGIAPAEHHPDLAAAGAMRTFRATDDALRLLLEPLVA